LRSHWWWSFFIWAALAGQVEAQENDADDTEAARQLFTEAVSALDQEEWERAAELLEQVLELRHTPQIAYNLSTALMHTGDLARAAEIVEQILADPAASERVRRAATARQRRLASRVPLLTLHLEEGVDPGQVTLDGRPLSATDIDVERRVNPGDHRIEVTLESRGVLAQNISLAEGEQREMTVSPLVWAESSESATATVGVDADGTNSGNDGRGGRKSIARSWWLWTIVGAAVAGTALAVGLAVGLDGDPEPASPVAGPQQTLFIGSGN
jgi:hypothetical protein